MLLHARTPINICPLTIPNHSPLIQVYENLNKIHQKLFKLESENQALMDRGMDTMVCGWGCVGGGWIKMAEKLLNVSGLVSLVIFHSVSIIGF